MGRLPSSQRNLDIFVWDPLPRGVAIAPCPTSFKYSLPDEAVGSLSGSFRHTRK